MFYKKLHCSWWRPHHSKERLFQRPCCTAALPAFPLWREARPLRLRNCWVCTRACTRGRMEMRHHCVYAETNRCHSLQLHSCDMIINHICFLVCAERHWVVCSHRHRLDAIRPLHCACLHSARSKHPAHRCTTLHTTSPHAATPQAMPTQKPVGGWPQPPIHPPRRPLLQATSAVVEPKSGQCNGSGTLRRPSEVFLSDLLCGERQMSHFGRPTSPLTGYCRTSLLLTAEPQ